MQIAIRVQVNSSPDVGWLLAPVSNVGETISALRRQEPGIANVIRIMLNGQQANISDPVKDKDQLELTTE